MTLLKSSFKASVLGLALVSTVAFAQETSTEPAATDAAPATDDTAKAPAKAAAGEEDKGYRGLLGPFKLGPAISVGLPHLIDYGLESVFLEKMFSVAFYMGGLPKTLEQSGAKFKFTTWDVRGRWHPFKGSLFLGASYGGMNLAAEAATQAEVPVGPTTQKVDIKAKADLSVGTFTPQFGWLWQWDAGFIMGMDIGYQLALSPKAEVKAEVNSGNAAVDALATDSEDYKKAKKNAEDVLKTVGETSLPLFTLLKFGWLF